jgi:2-oxoglutarate ferredoxin oxidoreductase subunit delta
LWRVRRHQYCRRTRKERDVAGIAIDAEQCKGCGLCVTACPQRVIAIGTRINRRGQFHAVASDPRRCIACRSCSIACPDAAIEVRAWGVAYECFAY